MNEIFLNLGIESWKPVVSNLLLPPVPFLVLMLIGARLMFRRRMLAWLLILLAVAGMWLSVTGAGVHLLRNWLLPPVRALSMHDVVDLKRAPKTAIVVLGGGRRVLAPEYGVATLKPDTIERLRYGLWLARETGLPVAFSGGVGHGAVAGQSEAEIASRVAERDFGRPLRWTETASRDTRENAIKTLAILQPQGIEQIVLVTSDLSMPRAVRNFERASGAVRVKIVPAPMALPVSNRLSPHDLMPSSDGFAGVREVLHEWIGLLAGA
ncbi:MAG: YdcF family protein [Rubrivivax sp.]